MLTYPTITVYPADPHQLEAELAILTRASGSYPPGDPSKPWRNWVCSAADLPTYQHLNSNNSAIVQDTVPPGDLSTPNLWGGWPALEPPAPSPAMGQNPPTLPFPVNVANLCTLARAVAVEMALNASGIPATMGGDDPSAAGYATVDYGSETRRFFVVIVNGQKYLAAPLDAQMSVNGVGAPGKFTFDGTNFQWHPAPPILDTDYLRKPCRSLAAGESIQITGLTGGYLLTNSAAAPAAGASSDKAELDQILAEEKKIEGALGIK